MKTAWRLPGQGRRAFTRVELIIVIILGLMIACLIMAMARAIGPNSRLRTCQNNQRQLAMAELIWSSSHGGTNFSAQISTNAGGSREFLMAGQIDLYFQNLAPALGSPALIHCPDAPRPAATNFAWFTRENISYFISRDAAPTNLGVFLSGDRNLTFQGGGGSMQTGQVSLTAKSALTWTREIHDGKGNVSFPDGHGETMRSDQLKPALFSLGANTNHLVFP